MCTPFLLGGLNLLPKYFKKGGVTGSEFLEGGFWKRRVTFFSMGEACSFYIKNKLKSEILNDKKNYKKKKC